MKNIVKLVFLFCFALSACEENSAVSEGDVYLQISAQEAKAIMDSGEDFVIVDAREQTEFDDGHIPGAILIPHGEVEQMASKFLTEKDAQVLVYCRTGRRSKIAAEVLGNLGYSNVKEFGGIVDWPYEVVK